jgi:hypothetical protein
MTAGPARVDPPPHPLYALTTSELSRYRRDLEQALAALPARDPARGHLGQQLAGVQAEQNSRTRLATGQRS